MKLDMISHEFQFTFPSVETPSWAAKVDRWYQLDAYAFGITQAYAVLRSELKTRPDFIFLASPGSSNETDHLFTSTGAASPSKFVHTLPNSRSASLLQVMEWTGPLLCLQSDPNTKEAAIEEARQFVKGGIQNVWVAGVEKTGPQKYRSFILEIFDSGRVS